MSEPKEIELKLICSRNDLVALQDHPRLTAVPAQVRARLISVYFDTPAGELRQAGYMLRVRSIEGRHIQTVKTVGEDARASYDELIDVRPFWR